MNPIYRRLPVPDIGLYGKQSRQLDEGFITLYYAINPNLAPSLSAADVDLLVTLTLTLFCVLYELQDNTAGDEDWQLYTWLSWLHLTGDTWTGGTPWTGGTLWPGGTPCRAATDGLRVFKVSYKP